MHPTLAEAICLLPVPKCHRRGMCGVTFLFLILLLIILLSKN
jgi:hypothetical protein